MHLYHILTHTKDTPYLHKGMGHSDRVMTTEGNGGSLLTQPSFLCKILWFTSTLLLPALPCSFAACILDLKKGTASVDPHFPLPAGSSDVTAL